MITISQRGIEVTLGYNLYFSDGINDVIVIGDIEVKDDKMILDIYAPIEMSLKTVKAAMQRIKENLNAKNSEI